MGRHSLEEGYSCAVRKDRNNKDYFVIEIDGNILSIPHNKLDDLIFALQSFEVTGDAVEIY